MKNENKNEKKLTFTGVVRMEPYTDRDGVRRESPAIAIDNPFDCEMDEFRLVPKWRTDKGIFDFKAKQALKTTDEVKVKGYFSVNSFTSKQTKKKVDCVGIYLENPFFSGEIELKNRNIEQNAVVAYLLSDIWGIKLSRYADEKDGAVDVDTDSN